MHLIYRLNFSYILHGHFSNTDSFFFSKPVFFLFQLTSARALRRGWEEKKKNALYFQTIFRDHTSERTTALYQSIGAGSARLSSLVLTLSGAALPARAPE